MNKQTLSYEVLTEKGNSYIWKFTEHLPQDKDHYGNGIYVSAECAGHRMSIDCRYQKYNFETICENWIKNYYDANLLKFMKI
ncbi:MAG: hypothetical protein E7342_03800 [Clostridiales bacterium]|nr:hypothetical protein [Clostridiales bacterium]